jgi:DtxR family Mn-dependent transcriptional regulator
MRKIEEILESVWEAKEQAWESTAAAVVANAHGGAGAADLEQAIERGLLDRAGDMVRFTARGEAEARVIVRRHRLAERLLSDVLQVEDTVVESSACEFEHFLAPEVTDSICTLLGHPTVCHHQHPIPPGPCCGRLAKDVGPVVRRLSNVAVGERVKVLFITSDLGKRLERLGSLGVLPGSVIRLTQRRPSFILEVDQTSLAVEREVAEGIYVRRWAPGNSAGGKAVKQ